METLNLANNADPLQFPDNPSRETGSGSRQTPSLDRRDALKRQQAIVALGRRVAARPEHQLLLHDTATMLCEVFDADVSGIAEMVDGADAMPMLLVRGFPDGGSRRVDTVETPLDGSRGLAARVLDVGHPFVVDQLSDVPDCHDEGLEQLGVGGALAAPLAMDGEAFGAVVVCSREDAHFQVDDLLFIEAVSHLITTALSRRHLEQELEAERRRNNSVLQSVNAIVLVLDQERKVLYINQAGEDLTGFQLEEIHGRAVQNVLAVPEEAHLFQQLSDGLEQAKGPIEYESGLLTKHGERRRISWRYQAIRDDQGRFDTIVATGIDTTMQAEAADRVRRAEEAAAQARRRLAEQQGDSTAVGDGLAGAVNQERRQRPRRAYPYAQKLAFVIGGRKPSPEDFTDVDCHDIASGGFSFHSETPPPSDSVVVALGKGERITHLTGQVAHVTRVVRDGRRLYLIGCSYTGRAKV